MRGKTRRLAERVAQRPWSRNGATEMATRVLLGFLLFAGFTGAIRHYNAGQSLGEILSTDFVFIAIGVIGLAIIWNDNRSGR